jgi:hypothetical protein
MPSVRGEVNVACSIHTLMQGFILSRADTRLSSEQVAATQFPEIEPMHVLLLVLWLRPDWGMLFALHGRQSPSSGNCRRCLEVK